MSENGRKKLDWNPKKKNKRWTGWNSEREKSGKKRTTKIELRLKKKTTYLVCVCV